MSKTKHNKQFPSPSYPPNGFTVIEIIIAIAITGILATILADFMQQSIQMQTFITEQSQAISEAQIGSELFAKEMREAASADTGAYIIEEATENSVIFYSDIDTDVAIERVHYYLDGNSFKKGIIEPTGIPLVYTGAETISLISNSVVNNGTPIFTYYTENYPIDTTPLPYPADVTSITLAKINLEINVNPEKVPDTYAVTTFIQLRNLKNNL